MTQISITQDELERLMVYAYAGASATLGNLFTYEDMMEGILGRFERDKRKMILEHACQLQDRFEKDIAEDRKVGARHFQHELEILKWKEDNGESEQQLDENDGDVLKRVLGDDVLKHMVEDNENDE